jgi:transcriptional regulator with XRE-family HTH domain
MDNRIRYMAQGQSSDNDTLQDMKALAGDLKSLREQARFEQGDAAAAVGISRVTLSRYENAKQRPPHDVVMRLINMYRETIQIREQEARDKETIHERMAVALATPALRLRAIASAFGLSDEHIATATGRSPGLVARWRHGIESPEREDYEAIARLTSDTSHSVTANWLERGGLEGGPFSNPAIVVPSSPSERSAARDFVDKVGDVLRSARRSLASPEQDRATLPRQLRILAAEFEVEALKLGANEQEMDYVRHALQSPETAKMFAYGYVSREGVSNEALVRDYQSLIDALRSIVKMRVKQRQDLDGKLAP